jgi:hypothetical protein
VLWECQGLAKRPEITGICSGDLGSDEESAGNSTLRGNQGHVFSGDKQKRNIKPGQLIEGDSKGECASR